MKISEFKSKLNFEKVRLWDNKKKNMIYTTMDKLEDFDGDLELSKSTKGYDKNDKLIYDGDIVIVELQKHSTEFDCLPGGSVGKGIGFICDSKVTYKYYKLDEIPNLTPEQLIEESRRNCEFYNLAYDEYIEVIGNIYENIEMLEEWFEGEEYKELKKIEIEETNKFLEMVNKRNR